MSAEPGSQTGTPTWDCQYERLVYTAQQGHRPGVVLVGSSLIFRGVHARPFSAAAGVPTETVLNLGLPGTGVAIHTWFATELVVPLLDPPTLVVGVSARCANVSSMSVRKADARMAHSALPGFVASGGLSAAIDAGRTKRAFAAVRRPDLDYGDFVAPGWTQRPRWPSECHQIRDIDWTVWDQDPADVARTAEGSYTDFDLGPGFGLLADMIDGVPGRVVLLSVPITPQLRAATPGGYGAFTDRLEGLGLEVLDASELLDGEMGRYRDAYHLNVYGARYLSRWLGRQLGGL